MLPVYNLGGMKKALRLRLRAYLMILPLVASGVTVIGVFTGMETRAALTQVTNRYMAFKAEQLRDYFFSEWDVLTRLGLDKYPEYGPAVERSFRSYAYSLLRSDTELIVVLDSSGEPLMLIRRTEDAAPAAAGQKEIPVTLPTGWFTSRIFGDERVGVAFDVSPMGWRVAVTELESAFFSDAVTIQRAYVLAFSLVIVVIAVILTILIRYIVRPVERLTAAMEKIAATGNLAERVRSELPDEIGALANVFNGMIGSLQASRLKLEETGKAEHAANESLKASLQEKNVLLKEIHHRVKNNLQVVSSLLYLQESRARDSESRSVLGECRSQIAAMALIHEDLYRSTDLASVDFGAYIRRLVEKLARTFGASPRVAVEFDLQEISLSIEKAIPCGLILNELCVNAFKHAFPMDQDGVGAGPPKLTVGLKRTGGGMVSLSVWDNGVGLPEGVDLRTTTSVGLQIVMTLVRQIDGSIRTEPGLGACFTVDFQA